MTRRARLDASGADETCYLDPLDAIVAQGRSPAQLWIEKFEGPWGRSVDPAFNEALL